MAWKPKKISQNWMLQLVIRLQNEEKAKMETSMKTLENTGNKEQEIVENKEQSNPKTS